MLISEEVHSKTGMHDRDRMTQYSDKRYTLPEKYNNSRFLCI